MRIGTYYYTDANGNATNTFKRDQAALRQPQVVPSTDKVYDRATVAAIVARAAHVLLQSELLWSTTDVLTAHPSLVGLTAEQIADAITEVLA